MAKKYKVGYKTMNAKIKVTREHLSRIKKHMTSAKDKKDIEAQVEAMGVILAACKSGKMSRSYPSS
jgi:lysozyme family protein